MTLPEDANHPFTAWKLSPAWIAELHRRTADLEAGLVELIDNDEVFAWVRARLRDLPPNTEPTAE